MPTIQTLHAFNVGMRCTNRTDGDDHGDEHYQKGEKVLDHAITVKAARRSSQEKRRIIAVDNSWINLLITLWKSW